MSDKQKEELSNLMDGEFQDADKLISALQQDADLRARWERYHLIRDALGNHLPSQIDAGLAERISAQIEQEPTVLAPKRKLFDNIFHKPGAGLAALANNAIKPAAGLAIAATIATVAIISVQNTRQANQNEYDVATVKIQPKVANFAEARLAAARKKHIRAVDSKLSGYLVKHNEYSVSARMQGALPYMRIVGDTVGQRTKNDK
ncbi:MAG: sigma-E factor negative regulatory protein [Gammaproteobacteria bacterium]|nr:sigma-E factor negative regulatory protein [Gammaproteobacteria bacterium]